MNKEKKRDSDQGISRHYNLCMHVFQIAQNSHQGACTALYEHMVLELFTGTHIETTFNINKSTTQGDTVQ